MGLMDEAMRADAEFTADTDQASESVSYTRVGGSPSTIRVVINRMDSEQDIAVNGHPAREFEVWIPYSSSYGLTSKPLPGDLIAVKDDFGDSTTESKSFDRVLETDAGGWLCRFI
jgi:hypothetical protein